MPSPLLAAFAVAGGGCKMTAMVPICDWKKAMRLRSLPWPASSPDLSLIENVWNIWRQRVQNRCPQTIEEMRRFIREEWDELSPELLQNLVSDMPLRCKEVIAAGGDRIRR